MYKYILQGAGDINWMGLFALLTFFSIFVISAIAIFGSSKKYVEEMSNMPLIDSYSKSTEKEQPYEK
jgi:hypothetical protein